MFKSTIAAAAAVAAFAPAAALAGPYVNVETNASWAGDDYQSATTDFHVGYEGPIGDGSAAWYVQGGPAIVAGDNVDATTEQSGKVGITVAAGERTDIYGEVSGITTDEINFDEDFNVGVKLGVKIAL